ncbi:MAG: hypothetical protein ACI9N9_000716 [Enterobacterales bacterium]|jgi:hypothetical protein
MTLQSLASLSEIIGGIAVVMSLIYLAVQIRQNTRSGQTENYARTLERMGAMQSTMANDGDFALLMSKGIADPSRLTTKEKIQFNWSMYESFGTFEFMFHTVNTNALPEEIWQRWSLTVAWWLTQPGVLIWWKAVPVPFTPSFTSYIESIINDNPTDMQATLRFQEFLREKKVKSDI